MGRLETRLEVVKMLISSQELSTQEELMVELKKAGFPTAQATLSRDLKRLRVVKVQNAEGRYVYMMEGSRRFRNVSDTHMTVMTMNRLGAIGVKFSGNLAVVSTLPGHASHVAYDIDRADIESVLGTIAGDDTVLMVLTEGADRSQLLDDLSQVIPVGNRD